MEKDFKEVFNLHFRALANREDEVDPDLRRQGFGSRLIKEGIRRCEELGYELILL
ncbi:GNAT family N-acetyltransferase [Cohnella lubricantis]